MATEFIMRENNNNSESSSDWLSNLHLIVVFFEFLAAVFLSVYAERHINGCRRALEAARRPGNRDPNLYLGESTICIQVDSNGQNVQMTTVEDHAQGVPTITRLYSISGRVADGTYKSINISFVFAGIDEQTLDRIFPSIDRQLHQWANHVLHTASAVSPHLPEIIRQASAQYTPQTQTQQRTPRAGQRPRSTGTGYVNRNRP